MFDFTENGTLPIRTPIDRASQVLNSGSSLITIRRFESPDSGVIDMLGSFMACLSASEKEK
jgi:hypothetical protein